MENDKNIPGPLWLIEDVDAVSHEEVMQHAGRYLFIVHCWQGRLQVTINDTSWTLNRDQLLICLPTFLVGNYMRTPDCRCIILCIEAEYFSQIVDRTFHMEPRWWEKYTQLQRNPIVAIDGPRLRLLESYYSIIKSYLAAPQDEFRQAMTRRLAELAYFEVSNYFDGNMTDSGDEAISQPDRLFRRFMNMLHTEYLTQREVAWYADQLHITPKYLTGICREKSGKTASQWIHDTLGEEIRRQLVETDIPIKDLAWRFGFPSQSFFGKYVKQRLGQPPQVYRINNRLT